MYGVYGVLWRWCTVCRRWVYVWLSCVYALGVRVYGVGCTLCVSFYDVVSI